MKSSAAVAFAAWSLGLAAFFARPAPALAGSSCPADTTDTGCMLMTAPHVSTDAALGCYSTVVCAPWQAGEPCPGACYDLPAGQVAVVLPGGIDCANSVVTADDYWITGIPEGLPTLFFAQLHVAGTLGDVAATASVGEGARNYALAYYGGSDSPLDRTLVVPLWRTQGEVFRIQLWLSAWNTSSFFDPADLKGTLEFANLPPTAVVHSCQGYNLPVPTLVRTWGRVKALFR